jgi:methylenetetrahydrofolate reductase (NADPH)
MKVIEHLNNRKSTLFSFEILPPLKSKSINSIYESIEPLLEFDPKFINVTYHREEFVYKIKESGYLEKVSIKRRPGNVGICAAIVNKYKIDTVPHLICGGFTRQETENALIDLQYLGIDNVLALRGDAIKTEINFKPREGGHSYAVDLVKQINNINKGVLLEEELKENLPDFCVGVAGYPEKHIESPNLDTDIEYLKSKIENGADYIVTQLFYDNNKFFEFVKKCKEAGINVPIIPGLKPIYTFNQLTVIPRTFNIDIPKELTDLITSAKSNEEIKQIGIEWAIKQSKELIKFGVPCIHFYTMGKSEAVSQIAKSVY